MWFLKLLGYGRWWGPSKKKSAPTPVDPVVVAPPQSTPERVECLPNTLHIFCEASYPLTFFGDATGRPANEIYYHAIGGVAYSRGKTFRLIHPWYDPCKQSVDIGSFVRQAKAEGCIGISVDHEGWCLAAGPGWLRSLSAACRSAGMLLAIVPKVRLEHIVNAWKMSAEEAGRIISETCDVCLEWQYLTTGDEYADSFEKDTVTCQQLGLIDGTGDRYKSAATRRGWIAQMRARGYSIGIFLPKDTELAPACRSDDCKLSMMQRVKRALNVGDEKIA
jgi:hypothetical protein